MSQANPSARLSRLALAGIAAVALAAPIGAAHADKVGIAAAVNPDAFSSLSGSPKTQLNIGKSIFFDERINTTGSGLVQVLLVDGSTFTVGPGSDLVIDKFVYDPNKKSGEVVASFSKGVMRFVGGKISKNEGGVTVNTPSGALAIRGGMFQGSVTGGKGVFSFLYGVNMTLTGKNGQQFTVFQPGNTIDTTSGTPTIRPTTTGDVNAFMNALSKGGTVVTLGGSNDKTNTAGGPPKQVVYETLSLQDLISDATQTSINDQVENQEDNGTTPTPTDTTTTPTDTTTTPTDTTTPPPPNTVTARVLLSPGVYTAFPGTPDQYTTDGGDQSNGVKQGILGGGNYPQGTPPPLADDFVWTFGFSNGRLVGTVSGLTDAHCGDGCNDIQTSNPPPAAVNFPETFNNCVNGLCISPVTDATITQGGKTVTFRGLAVQTTGFFAYQLIGATNTPISNSLTNALPVDNTPSGDPLLVFGGKGYNFGTPSGRIFAFELTPDVKEALNGAIAPFSGGGSAPVVPVDQNGQIIGPAPSISPLLYKETDSNNSLSRAVWLQTSLYINTSTNSDQQSFVNVALGGVDPNSGGLVGARRGGSSVDMPTENGDCEGPCPPHRDQIAFTGDIATLAGPDGSHFLGKDNPNIVIGFDSTGTHNIGRDIPLDQTASGTSVQDQSGSTYHIGVGLGTLPAQQQTYDGEFKGYAAGLYTQPSGQPGLNGTGSPVGVLTSGSPNDFSINFNPQQNTLSATLTVAEADPDGDPGDSDDTQGSVTLGFGDSSDVHGPSAFIDNLHYAALETPGGTTVYVLPDGGDESTPVQASSPASTSYLVSGDQLGVTHDTFNETSPGVRPFCENCDFLKWGAWGTRTNFADPNAGNATSTMNVHLGWWAAASLTSTNDIESLVTQHMTADYSGHALGNVASEIGPDQWKTYVAAGDLEMHWDFACRNGELTISHFDNHTFDTGPHGLTQVGAINQFQGSFQGIQGGAVGSFADNIINNQVVKAGGVLGNFYVNEAQYKASGIFAGSGIPHGRD